ncbi:MULTISPECIES: chloride channel protein [Spirulina sp. CCY15215]|uniref:chloride channel protein n=1 Tax=Spirulina sp. CCY15215 TaxID=2767591 RepID=UPI0019503BAF|nr:chloride channel protein [Spirulina major]
MNLKILVTNKFGLSFLKNRHLGNQAVKTYYALAEACLIGAVSGIAALLLKKGVGFVGGFRLSLVEDLGIWILPLFGFILCWIAGWLVEHLSPAANGGGVSQVKAALAKFPIPLTLRVAIVKTLGAILVLGGGLTLGRRGATVHIGAALAGQLSQWVPTSPQHRRQMIAAGAAAGLAAGFNTPIAGVLFVVEELSRDMSGLTLETSILASFTGSVVSRLLGSADLNLPQAILVPQIVNEFTPLDIPFYILLGVAAGVLGVFFNRGMLWSRTLHRRLNIPMSWRLGFIGLISGTAIAFSPDVFRNNAGLRDFLVTGEADLQNIAIAFMLHFGLTILASGAGAPGGLFAPSLVLGSALGSLIGGIGLLLGGVSSQTTYALVGMGAFFTGVARVPVTAIVIVFELTTDFQLVLPLMISSVVAYGVGEALHKGSLYQHLLEASGIKLKDGEGNRDVLEDLTAADVLQARMDTLPLNLTVEETIQAFSRSEHHGFPVVDEGNLVGMVTETQLANLGGISRKSPLRQIMTHNPIAVHPEATLSDVLYLMDRYQISHLPVTEGRRLVGIITRSDLIHATADRLRVNQSQGDREPDPSYSIYHVRAPVTGKGRILLPLSNPHTAATMLEIGLAIAKMRNCELECLHVILIPLHNLPAQTAVDESESHKLLAMAQDKAQEWGVSLHLQIRVAHNTARAVLDVVRERHIDLLLMGWKGFTATPDKIFGDAIDTLIHQAYCEVVLVKLGKHKYSYPLAPTKSSTWLIPTAGGPNMQRGMELLPAFALLTPSPHLLLCQIHTPDGKKIDTRMLEETADRLRKQMETVVQTVSWRSDNPVDAIVQLSEVKLCDLTIIGASQEGLMQQAMYGNIPEAIASGIKGTVILVRGALN